MNYQNYADICKALGDPTRANIFDMLKGGEMCACKILEAFDITQPTLSYHMKLLALNNLVCVRKEGKWNHYRIDEATVQELLNFLAKKE